MWAISERPPERFPILSGAVFQADPSRPGTTAIASTPRTRESSPPLITSSTVRTFPIDSCCGAPTVRAACTVSTAVSARPWTASLSWSPPYRSAMPSILSCWRSGFPVSATYYTSLHSQVGGCRMLYALANACSYRSCHRRDRTQSHHSSRSRHPRPSSLRYPSFRPSSRQSLPPRVHGPRLAKLVVIQRSRSQWASKPFQRPNSPWPCS